ncbi:radical SAM protein [Pseudomonas sp. ESBL2]|uniref:radical SAM protein n=1 Tax=Pseudomonas sp. ESBL2 TaxID=3077325 RepID=UPI002FC96B82
MNRLSLARIISVAQWWKENAGLMQVEVAALEPLLWREGNVRVGHVVAKLKAMGFRVSMTSNGSLLARQAQELKEAGLDLLRLSWHSMSPDIYRRVTGGGNLEKLIEGIRAGIDCSLPMSLNRVLMRGHTTDLPDQLAFIDQHQLRLKLLDLYWTEESAAEYDRYYITPEEALEELVASGYLKLIQDDGQQRGRSRVRYLTPRQGLVEYKLKSTARKSNDVCDLCTKKSNCLEGYGDYFRVFPEGKSSLCYLRQDLAYSTYENDTFVIAEQQPWAQELRSSISSTPLRLVLEGRCNFNCGFPNTVSSWCLKQGKGYQFPDRSGVILREYQ